MDLISQAYQLFSGYQISEIHNVCTECCLDENEVNRLVNTDVKNIDLQLLSTYNDSAQATKPIINEYKHFLPRYLELIDAYNFPSHSLELSLRNIAFYEKEEWLSEEWELINTFVNHFFRKTLNAFPIQYECRPFTSIMVMLDNANFNITPFLQIWESSDSKAAAIHYKDMMADEFDWMRREKLRNGFASKKVSELLSNWAFKKSTQQIFQKKFESIIMNEVEMEERDLNELNWLYDAMEKSDF